MSSGQSNNPAPEEVTAKKTRKPYTITKSRESWTDEEHDKFLEALHLFDRDWKKIEDFVGSKTVIQIRSHAQKYFLKVQKNGTVAHVPPPRPKRKATHPYPQKSPINGPPQSAVHYSASSHAISTGYPAWKEASIMMNTSSSRIMPSQDDYNLNIQEDNGSKVFPRITGKGLSESRSSSRLMPEAVSSTQEKGPMLHGLPDFAEVYSFIGSVFDPGTQGHGQKLKEMDPINFETVLLLMQNLTLNLTSSDFEPIKNVLSSYDVATKSVTLFASEVAKSKATDVSC